MTQSGHKWHIKNVWISNTIGPNVRVRSAGLMEKRDYYLFSDSSWSKGPDFIPKRFRWWFFGFWHKKFYKKYAKISYVRKKNVRQLKFIYSEKATIFCEIFTLLLTGTTKDKSRVKISQNFEAFSEYMNFRTP